MPGDTRVWDQIRATVADIGRASVRTGVLGDKASAPHGQTGESNGEIALWMEYGTKHIPERSFIRSTLRDPHVVAGLAALQTRLVAAVIAGRLGRDEALAEIGEWISARIKERILNHEIRPEDAPSTVAAKGSDVPLLESYALVEAVGWKIVK